MPLKSAVLQKHSQRLIQQYLGGEPVIRIPLFVVYAIVALNITAFTVLLQMDWLIFHSVVAKGAAWLTSLAAWQMSYWNRHKMYLLRI
jgi:hypothetical protein